MEHSGSWSDLEGFRVHFTQRNHHPLCFSGEDHLKGSQLVRGFGHSSESSLGGGGKRRFSPRYCSGEEKPSGKRVLPAPVRVSPYDSGKKLLPVARHCTSEIALPRKRKNEEASQRTSKETLLPSASWTRKHNVVSEDGTPARDKESGLVSLEADMTRKHRVQNILESRNLIPVKSMGDLPYAEADREPGFYAKGGLIPGSTNTLRPSAKPTPQRSEANSAAPTSGGKKLEATYGLMKTRLERDYDLHQVLSLTVGSSTRHGDPIPSWEAATGCYLVAPEDEAF